MHCVKKSIVLFESTLNLFYRYAEKVRFDACKEPCGWKKMVWNTKCEKWRSKEKTEVCMEIICIEQLEKCFIEELKGREDIR